MPNLFILALIILVALIILLVVALFLLRSYDRKKTIQKELATMHHWPPPEHPPQDNSRATFILGRGWVYDESSTKIQEKRQTFLAIPAFPFHFTDNELIKDCYDTFFPKPKVQSVVAESAGEVRGEFHGGTGSILGASVGGSGSNKVVTTATPQELTLNGMVLAIQNKIIQENNVLLGIEEAEIESSELSSFDKNVSFFQIHYGITFEETEINDVKARLRDKAAIKTLSTLEQASGWVLIEGNFIIGENDDSYTCKYYHPINDYLSDKIHSISIVVVIPKASLRESYKGYYKNSIGRPFPLRVFGAIVHPINRKNNIYELLIHPIAVY